MFEGLPSARENAFYTAPEAVFLQPDIGADVYHRSDLESGGNGFSDIESWITHITDGRVEAEGYALNGQEGQFTATWTPRFDLMEHVMRNICGLPESDTVVDSGTRRRVVWNYPANDAPAIETWTGYWGKPDGAYRLTGGKVVAFNVDVRRIGDGGTLGGSMTIHFNRVERNVEIPGLVAQNAVMTVTFTQVPASQELRIFAGEDGADFALITAGGNNAAWETAIESLTEYAGFPVTVSGALADSTVNGVAVKTGTLTLTFTGNGDIPLIYVRTSESQRITIVNGSGDYTINGSGAVQLNDSLATIQTAVRATGGNYANVVVQGTLTSETGTLNVIVADAGDVTYNGTYVPQAAINGFPAYNLSTNGYIWKTLVSDTRPNAGGNWIISNGPTDAATVMYYSAAGGSTVPATGWTAGEGDTPAPTVTPPTFVAGSASLLLLFPYTVGSMSNAAVTGTGSSILQVTNGATAAETAFINEIFTQRGSDGNDVVFTNTTFFEPSDVRIYIAEDRAAMEAIDYTDLPDEYGVGGADELIYTASATSFGKDALWMPFYGLSGKRYPTQANPGARGTTRTIDLPHDLSEGSDFRFMLDTADECMATGFWMVQVVKCDLYEFRVKTFVGRSEAVGRANDNDLYLGAFPLTKMRAPDGAANEVFELFVPAT